jgi:two-component system, chemotaxis family, CheB/CheR fusion protein
MPQDPSHQAARLPPDPGSDSGLRPSGLAHTVVGIGASAGGIQALLSFFSEVPAGSGMSFVVVMHLSPTHESHAAAILQRVTAMPVVEVTEALDILPDHVYVIPPARGLWMKDGRLRLRPAPRVEGRNVAIDQFFRVLAQVHRHHAVAIVLSGTGTDGAVGLARIKELGGVTLAQWPGDAQQPGMPQAAIATGMVDFVLSAAEMPAKLTQLSRNARSICLPADVAAEMGALAATGPTVAERAEAALADILALLRARTQHDFRHYKRPTVLRRLERRMQVVGVPTLEAYRDHLLEHLEETPSLLQDMLISVTNFFRDREAYEALARDMLPALRPHAGSEVGLRAWVVGCATGEEAYSLAMLLQEQRERTPGAPPFQVFATDIDERALAVARTARYPGSIATDVSPERLRRFFTRDREHYRVSKSLRERVLFAQHNVLREPPFSRMDLVSCRNLLIYLNGVAQAAVMHTFRFALRPGGVLFLGSSESVDVAGDNFAAVDKKHRLYRVAGGVPAPTVPVMPLPPQGVAALAVRPQAVSPAPFRRRPYADVHQRAMLSWAPPSVLVDDRHRILHLSASAPQFLQVPAGLPTHQLLDHVHPDLRLDLRSALFRVQGAGEGRPEAPVVVDSRMGGQPVRISVQALGALPDLAPDPLGDTGPLLVVFEPLDVAPAPRGDDAGADLRDVAALGHLEDENRRLQEQLKDVIERAESSNEELMSSNEELQAVNEELRSATEELETSREELQSINEELSTVNSQLALQVEDSGRVNDDLRNLINASDIATVFVDREMRVKRFTPRATGLFNLIDEDVGRSLLDITHRLDYAELLDDAQAAFQELRLVEREVRGTDGGIFVSRMLPYRTTEDKIEGAILSFVDVTALRRSEAEARAGAERLALAAESTRDFAIMTTDDDGRVTGWNPGAERLFGYGEAEIVGRPLGLTFTDEDQAAGVPAAEIARARESGRSEDERWHRRKDGSVFYCSGVTTRLEGGRGFAKIARDLTGNQQAVLARERLLSHEQAGRRRAEATMEAKEMFLAVLSHELKNPLNLIHLNAELLARMPEIRALPAAARAAGIIQQTVDSQARIIDDLLDLSRARTGKLRLEKAAVDWVVLVRRIVEAARPEAKARNVHLAFEPGSVPLVALFDPVRAEQVVWNLLGNALKFTADGGAVRVALASAGERLRLSVTDNGRGIAPEFIDRVFDMFSQEEGRRRHEDGLGIGLALVRELVLAQGGQVEARSEGLGRGSEFVVWLPLAPDATPPAPAPLAASVLQGQRVLVVDDSAEAVETFAMLLRLTGAEVTAVQSGEAALQALDAGEFDLLISDIGMPGMSGHEMMQAVRQRLAGRRLMALACTGYSRPQDEQRALEAGFDALLPKPASLAQLECAVEALQAARG